MSGRKLTLRQKRFADYYIELGHTREAAIKAGYSEAYAKGNAHKLLVNVSIKAYIDERLSKMDKKKVADQQEVMELLTAIARGESVSATLRGIGEGAQTIEENMPPTTAERIKAAELIGKRHMMWTEKQEVKVTVPTIINNVPLED